VISRIFLSDLFLNQHQHADLRENAHRKDDHFGSGAIGYDRQRQVCNHVAK
jgi:hypothetical protein